MKLFSKLVFVSLIGATLVYSSCSKTQNVAPATSTGTDNLTASKQIAVSLYKSISGSYGAANISDGIQAPNSISTTKGPRINDTQPYCGLTIDTTLNFTTLVFDTTKTVYSHYKFIYTCSSHALDGYILSDSIAYTDKGAKFLNKYITGQNYTVNRIGNDYTSFTMKGTIGTSFHTSDLNGSSAVIAYNNADTKFTLNTLAIKITNGDADITSGTTSFSATITYLDATAGGKTVTGKFNGSMTFLGNHMVKVIMHSSNGSADYSYLVNVQTGDTTQA